MHSPRCRKEHGLEGVEQEIIHIWTTAMAVAMVKYKIWKNIHRKRSRNLGNWLGGGARRRNICK